MGPLKGNLYIQCEKEKEEIDTLTAGSEAESKQSSTGGTIKPSP